MQLLQLCDILNYNNNTPLLIQNINQFQTQQLS